MSNPTTFCEDCNAEIAPGALPQEDAPPIAYRRCIRCARQRLDIRIIHHAVKAGRLSIDAGHDAIEDRLAGGGDRSDRGSERGACSRRSENGSDPSLCPVCGNPEDKCTCCPECRAAFPADCACTPTLEVYRAQEGGGYR
jgi:hypothetical protein